MCEHVSSTTDCNAAFPIVLVLERTARAPVGNEPPRGENWGGGTIQRWRERKY